MTYEEILSYPVLGDEGDEVKTAMLRNIYEKRKKTEISAGNLQRQ